MSDPSPTPQGDTPWLPDLERFMRPYEVKRFAEAAGLSPEEAAIWANLGILPGEAKTAIENGLSAEECAQRIATKKKDTKSHQLLVALPSEERVAWERFSLPDEVVVRWVNDNWKPADAAPWIRANASIEDARVWNPRHSPEIRFTYEAAQAWGAIGCDTSTAHHWAKRGFQPDQLVRFRATEQVMPEAPRGAIGWGAWRGCYIVADQQAIEVTTRRAATLHRMRRCTRWGELYSDFSPEAIEREFADVLDDCWLEHCDVSMPWQEDYPKRPPDFRPSGPFFLNFARQARIHPLDLLAQAPTPLDLEPARKVPSRTTQNVWDLAEELCDIADISATNAYRLNDVQSAVDRMLQQR